MPSAIALPRCTPANDRPLRTLPPSTVEFPIFLPGSARDAFTECPRSIPWERLAAVPPERVLHNHGTTLAELAQRGGLDPREIQALFQGIKLTVGVGGDMVEGVAFVKDLISAGINAAPWVEPAPCSKPPNETRSGGKGPPAFRCAPTELASTAPEAVPDAISPPSAALIEIDPERPPETSVRRNIEAYAKVMRQLGPATVKEICAYTGASKAAVTVFLTTHPDQVVSAPGPGVKGRLWTWIGDRAPVEAEHKPTDHIPPSPTSSAAPEPPISGPIPPPETVSDDLATDADLAPLLAPTSELTLGGVPMVMVPKRLLVAIMNAPTRLWAIDGLITFISKALDIPVAHPYRQRDQEPLRKHQRHRDVG